MAKKKKSGRALTGKRLMMKEMMHYKFNMDPTSPVRWDLSKNGYQQYSQTWRTAGAGYLVGKTYFDLSGYTLDKLSTFPQMITVQESGSYRMKEDLVAPAPTPPTLITDWRGAMVIDIITEEHLSDEDVATLVQNCTEKELCPSFPEGPLEFSQVIYGRYRMMGHDNAIWTVQQGNLTVLNQTQWGSGSPTTCDKLWIYRIIVPLGFYITDTDDYIICPAARYVMSASIEKENDSAYMMRQKRSYELAT